MSNIGTKRRFEDITEEEWLEGDRQYEAQRDARHEREMEKALSDQQNYLAAIGRLEGLK